MSVRKHWSAARRVSASHADGFTLFELMLAIAVIAVIAGFAVPSFVDIVRSNRIVTDNNEIVSALALARSEAIKSGVRTTMCRSADQATCAGSGGWEQGWIVFSDPANPGVVDAGEIVIRVWGPLQGGSTVRSSGAFNAYLSFVGTGETRGDTANVGDFRVCGKTGDIEEGRTINVGFFGSAATTKGVSACP
ncbi:MAG: GspH/FimT family pseudopilin [Pseudomonadota bacterium]